MGGPRLRRAVRLAVVAGQLTRRPVRPPPSAVPSLLLFVAASAWCAAAPTVGWLVAGRAVQGAAAAASLPAALALVIDVVGRERRARTLGLIEGLTGLATAAGPILGGAIASTVGWRWAFWVNVPIGLAAVGVARHSLPPERERRGAHVDLAGGVLVAVTIGAVVFSATEAASSGPASVPVVVALSTAGVAGVLLLRHLRRATDPLVPSGLFVSWALTGGLLATGALFGSIYGSVLFTAQYFQLSLNLSPAEAGMRLLPWTITLFLVAPLAGILADRFGETPLIAIGLVRQACGMGWLSRNVGDPGYLGSLLPLLVAGVGASAAIPAAQSRVLG